MRGGPKYRRVAVKIGSNVLTRADGSLDFTRMSALVDQVAELRRNGVKVIMVSSGAVAAGRNELKLDQGLDSVSARQLYSAVGQTKLINHYFDLFREHGMVCGQVLTTKENFSTRRHYLNQRHCMEVMLENDVIPIVNENDTTSLTELMFTDNDELSGLIASMMGMQALVILSNIDGVYTGDPRLPGSKLITDIHRASDAEKYISESRSSLGRGGMTTKYRIATKVAEEGIAVMIANGKRTNILVDLLIEDVEGTPHTLFHPGDTATTGVKKWIAHSEDFAKGTVTINDGAVEALRSPARASLLPVGVISIEGTFDEGDIVRVCDSQGNSIAWGCAGYNSSDAAAIIGRRDARPLIHTDYLYID